MVLIFLFFDNYQNLILNFSVIMFLQYLLGSGDMHVQTLYNKEVPD